MQSFIQYLIEARYAGDHPLVAQIKHAMTDTEGADINVGEYSTDEIQRALISGLGEPETHREPTRHQLGELFWDIDGYDVYFLYPQAEPHPEDPRDHRQFSNVYVDKQVPNNNA